MKVALLNDLPVQQGYGSGAELSIRYMAEEGIRQGHTVDFYTAQTFTRPLDDYDIIIAKNIVSFNSQQIESITRMPYVMWPSDYTHCKWRLYYCMREKCRKCRSYPGVDMARTLYKNSVLNVFLSPLHLRAYEYVIPEISDMYNILSPPYVDIDLFKPVREADRLENTVIGVNSLVPFKGAENVVNYAKEHDEMTFNFYGGVRDGWDDRLPDNAFYFGYAIQELLPELYSQASHFIHLPGTPQPFERTVIEAKLCGVDKFIVNKNVGAMSYRWVRNGKIKTVKKNLTKARQEFWSALVEVGGWY